MSTYVYLLFVIIGLFVLLVIDNIRLRQKNKKLKLCSETEELTGAQRKEQIKKKLGEEISRSKRFKKSFAVLMMDLDNFKDVNDTKGHEFGDFVLENIGVIVRNNIRENIDLFIRYGGDEFLIVFPETNVDGGMTAAEKLKKLIEEYEFEAGVKITASFGVAVYPFDGKDVKGIIRAADSALLISKRSRNKVTLYTQ